MSTRGPTANDLSVPPDVIVIGGGPVGLATALYAARLGLAPVVLEPRAGAIDKACGEGLMPGGLEALHHLGIDPAGHVLRGIRYIDRSRVAQADFSAGPGRGIRRTTLHHSLRDAVAQAGVGVLGLASVAVVPGDRAVTVRTAAAGRSGPTLSAPWVVAADGLHSPTRRGLGLDRSSTVGRRARRYGLRQHYGIRPWSEQVEVHWGPHAEAYVTPVGDDLVGVAVLSRQRIPFAESLEQFPALRDRLAGADVVTSVRGAGPLRQRAARRVAGRVLLVGDASGYVDALTGEGISLGFAQARAAVSAIAGQDPQSYERAWVAATRRYTILTHALLQATRPRWGRRLLLPAAIALPAAFRSAVNELAGVAHD